MKLGLIVNPIAGMGGRVGLKGTDGEEVLKKAVELGAVPESPRKAVKALEVLLPLKDELEILTYPGKMGEEEAIEAGFLPKVLGEKLINTSPTDTEEAAKKLVEEGVDIILFAGGDGTARNIAHAIETKVPVIGIPAGVKIHSAVYANDPRSAGNVVLNFFEDPDIELKEAEVMDIDETAFRQGVVTAKLYGHMMIPVEETLTQSTKASGGKMVEEDILEAIAMRMIDDMEDDVYYIIGSGTSTRYIMDLLELENTLLGVDIVKNKELVAKDVNEKEILDIIREKPAKLIITVIGGQGYILGRGNQQLSADVIKTVGKDNIRVIATKSKLMSLRGKPLLVDTGDDEVNNMFTGHMRVFTNYDMENIMEVKGL